MAKKICNYLRTYRRRSPFSQKELAFLLGYRSSSIVRRFEQQQRRITLGVAVAYQLIFGGELKEAFPALFERVEEGLSWRVQELCTRIKESAPSQRTARKLQVLSETLTRLTEQLDHQEA